MCLTYTYLHIIIFTQVGQLQVEVGEVDADGISLGDGDIPDSLLVIGVGIWKVRRGDPPIHFLQHDTAGYSTVKRS